MIYNSKRNAIIGCVLAITLLLVACGRNHVIKDSARTGRKNIRFGGVLRVNEISEIKTLFPHNLTSSGEVNIASQIFEGLVSLDQKTLEVIPSLAEKWEVNQGANVFRFHLRRGVKFHENDCFGSKRTREVTAQDFEYCLTKLCEANSENKNYWLFTEKVKGADDYYLKSASGIKSRKKIEGIRVIDDYTLEIELKSSYADFPMLLTSPGTWVFPREAYENGNELKRSVGTGPFMCKINDEEEVIILEKNRGYWKKDKKGNKLPYLEAIKITFVKDKEKEILAFRQGFIDMVHQIPVNKIDNTLGDLDYAKRGKNRPFFMQNASGISHVFIGFNKNKQKFKDLNLRRALNLAIDREFLINYTLLGEGVPADKGIVPPALKNYPSNKVKGFQYNPVLARKLIEESVIGKNKDSLNLSLLVTETSTDVQKKLAFVIRDMLKKNLNINLEIRYKKRSDDSLEESDGPDMWMEELSASYPNPEVFLRNFYSKCISIKSNNTSCYENQFGFKNTVFDNLYELGIGEIDNEKRMKLFCNADQIIIDEAALIPLYYTENIRIISKNIREFPINGMEVRDFSSIYFYGNI